MIKSVRNLTCFDYLIHAPPPPGLFRTGFSSRILSPALRTATAAKTDLEGRRVFIHRFQDGPDWHAVSKVLIAAAAPPAAMGTLLSIRYGKNSVYASEIFTAGTILSVASLPLVVNATEYLTKKL